MGVTDADADVVAIGSSAIKHRLCTDMPSLVRPPRGPLNPNDPDTVLELFTVFLWHNLDPVQWHRHSRSIEWNLSQNLRPGSKSRRSLAGLTRVPATLWSVAERSGYNLLGRHRFQSRDRGIWIQVGEVIWAFT
jgi:hypothetical protein